LFEAELAGKLPELKSYEDYLTSCIFGVLKYLSPNDGLFPLLNASFSYQQKKSLEAYLKLQNVELTDFDKVQCHFWPRSSIYGEPDLIITLEGNLGSFLVPIEIKYFSGKHGEGEKDQLMRYYLALSSIEGRQSFHQRFSGDILAFIYLTPFEAEYEIEQSLNILRTKGIEEAQNKFFHLKWQEIFKVVDLLLSNEQDSYKKAIYEDIKRLLEFKNLLPFAEFSELPTELSSELLLQFPIFFESKDVKSSRFFKGFLPPPKTLELKYKTTVYYGGLQ